MSSELSSLNPAVTTDRPVGYGTSTAMTQPSKITAAETLNPKTSATKQAVITPPNSRPTLADQATKEAKKNEEEIKAKEFLEEQKDDAAATSMDVSELKEVLDEINSALYSYNRSLRFELYEETDDLVVKVFNTKTDEIIRQYPSEEVLERKAKLLEGSTSFFSTKVS